MCDAASIHEHVSVPTTCGRTLQVGLLPMTGVPKGGRVTLAVDCAAFDADQVWLSLTREEAQQLAGALVECSGQLACGAPAHEHRRISG